MKNIINALLVILTLAAGSANADESESAGTYDCFATCQYLPLYYSEKDTKCPAGYNSDNFGFNSNGNYQHLCRSRTYQVLDLKKSGENPSTVTRELLSDCTLKAQQSISEWSYTRTDSYNFKEYLATWGNVDIKLLNLQCYKN